MAEIVAAAGSASQVHGCVAGQRISGADSGSLYGRSHVRVDLCKVGRLDRLVPHLMQ